MNKTLLHLYVFGVGAAILALEVSASRLLAPFFGSSLAVWGNILGVVLGALAFGYYAGGKLADGAPHRATLGGLTWVGGMLVSAIPLAAPILLETVSTTLDGLPLFLIAASFMSMLLLFAFPLFLLGAISPLANRIGVASVQDVGKVSGSLSAASTAGSLLGAFLPAFVTIPLLGTRLTILGSGAVLLLLGAYALRKQAYYLGLLLPIAILLNPPTESVSPQLLYEKDSAYQHVRVIEDEGRRYLLADQGAGYQTVGMDEIGLTDSYLDTLAASAYLLDDGRPPRILVIGLAGGALVRQFRHFLGPDARIDAVEIDPLMPEVAERYFGLRPEDAAVTVADGRMFLKRTDAAYDLIVVDAFRNERYIPFHLSTVEFFRLVAARLAPDGIMALNVPGAISDDALPGYVGETVREAFPVTADAPHARGRNHVIIGSAVPIAWARLAAAPVALAEATRALRDGATPVVSTGRLLTDDRAPIEMLTDRFFRKLVAGS